VEWYEVQGTKSKWSLDLNGATGGSFTITLNGMTLSHSVSYDVSAEVLEALLEHNFAVGDVTVTETSANVFDITFETYSGEPTMGASFSLQSVSGSLVSTVTGVAYTALDSDSISGYDLDVSSGASLSYTIQNLTPGTPYHVRVSAINDAGMGVPCVAVTATPRSAPSQPQTVSVRLMAGSSSSVRLYWTEPRGANESLTGDANGAQVDSYRVEWSLDESFETFSVYENLVAIFKEHPRLDPYLYAYEVQGLSSGKPYYFRVAAINEMGRGPYREAVPEGSAVAGSLVPRTAPDAIEYGSAVLQPILADGAHTVYQSSQSLRVSWESPKSQNGSEIESYTVEWWKQENSDAANDNVRDGAAGRPEIQHIKISRATSGSFVLEWNGETTDHMDFDVSSELLREQLESLSTVQSVYVDKTTPQADVNMWRVTFTGDAGNLAHTLVVHDSGLSPQSDVDVQVSGDLEDPLSGDINVDVGSVTVFINVDHTSSSLSYGDWIKLGNSEYNQIESISSDRITLKTPYLGISSISGGTAYVASSSEGFGGVPGALPAEYGTITLTRDENSGEWQDGIENEGLYQYTITGLSPGVSYFARVSSSNDRGNSKPRHTVPDNATPPKQKPDLPRNVRVSSHSGSSLYVTWLSPESDGGDMVNKYRIEWDTSASFDSALDSENAGYYESQHGMGDCSPTPCNYAIRSLTQGTPYHVRIYAHNSFGYSVRAASDSRGDAVRPVTLPSKPLDVSTEAQSTTSLRVKWKTPSNEGGIDVTRYEIRYDVSGSLNRDMGGTVALFGEQEIQQIETSADTNNIGGTFRVMFEGESTLDLSHDISAEDMRDALQGLPSVGSVRVVRTESNSNGHVWKITFLTNRGNLTPLSVSTSSDMSYDISTTRISSDSSNFVSEASAGTLLGTNAAVKVTTLSHGNDGFERQNVTIGASTGDIQGAFSLTFDGMTTHDLSWDASAEDVKIAFQSLESAGQVRVLRKISDFGFTWSIMFLDRLGNQPLITATNISALSGSDVFVNVAPVDHGDLPALDSALMGSVVVDVDDLTLNSNGFYVYDIENLVQGEPYYVDVSAWNGVSDRFGPSQFAVPALNRPCDKPEQPRLVETSPTSDSSFEISWSSPLSDNGCEITDYIVEWDTHAGYSEVQRVRLNGISGKFALSYKGQRTKYFNMFASVSEIETGVEMLDGIGDVKVQMLSQQSSSVVYTLTFLSNVGDMDDLVVHAMLKSSESANTESSEFVAEEYLKGMSFLSLSLTLTLLQQQEYSTTTTTTTNRYASLV